MIIIKKLPQLFSLMALLFFTGMAQATTLSFGSISQSGNSLDVEVNISGLGSGAAPSISTYDLDIQYDDSHLSYVSTNFGDSSLGNQLDLFDFGINDTVAALTPTGDLNIFELSFDLVDDLNNSQADSFTLATLSFDILKADTSQLDFAANSLGDADGNPLTADFTSSNVSTVPVPASFWFMVSGLTALLRIRKTGTKHAI